MNSIRFLAVVAIAVAVPAFAELSPKYTNWAKSPQAMFMTRAERVAAADKYLTYGKTPGSQTFAERSRSRRSNRRL